MRGAWAHEMQLRERLDARMRANCKTCGDKGHKATQCGWPKNRATGLYGVEEGEDEGNYGSAARKVGNLEICSFKEDSQSTSGRVIGDRKQGHPRMLPSPPYPNTLLWCGETGVLGGGAVLVEFRHPQHANHADKDDTTHCGRDFGREEHMFAKRAARGSA